MQTKLRFICCSTYDFAGEDGSRVKGISCKCFDERSKKIVKVATKHLLDCEFGDEIIVEVVPNGNYLNYQIAE